MHTAGSGRFWLFSFWPLVLMGFEILIRARRKKHPVQVLSAALHDGDMIGKA